LLGKQLGAEGARQPEGSHGLGAGRSARLRA
jgi:hypothetical protein